MDDLRGLDVQCIEAMGWKRQAIPVVVPDPSLPRPTFTLVVDLGSKDCWVSPTGEVRYLIAGYPFSKAESEIPHYSTEHAAARLLEDEVERRSLRAEYITAIGEVIRHAQAYIDGAPVYPAVTVWDFMRATPAQRARAFLEAVRVTE